MDPAYLLALRLSTQRMVSASFALSGVPLALAKTHASTVYLAIIYGTARVVDFVPTQPMLLLPIKSQQICPKMCVFRVLLDADDAQILRPAFSVHITITSSILVAWSKIRTSFNPGKASIASVHQTA